MARLVRSQIEAKVAEEIGDKTTAKVAVATVVDSIQRALVNGDDVQIRDFGTLVPEVVPSRMVRNPATGKKVRAKKKGRVKFRPAENLKELVVGRKRLPKQRKKTT